MANHFNNLFMTDPELCEFLEEELVRQRDGIEMIASENFTSLAVMEAQGSWLTNKYAEGLPSKRYYGGCEAVDKVEQLAIDRAKALFKADHANVQPHSGASANLAVYYALLSPGDTILGMNLSQGGHLTHGSPVSISGRYFNAISYGVDRETGLIDYDEMARLARTHKPKLIVAGASAYSRKIHFDRFAAVAKEVGAYFMVDMAHIAGLVAAGLHDNPVHVADVVTSTTHKTLRGPRGGLILCTEALQKQIDKAVFPGLQGGPLMHVIAAKAVAFKEALDLSFTLYQGHVIKNAQTLAGALVKDGFDLLTGGTDNHLVLVDLRNKGLTGKVAEQALDRVGITVNKNSVPFDTESPFVTSGIRIGTPAATTRGMMADQMIEIAGIIRDVLSHLNDDSVQLKAAARVKALSKQFPLYTELN